MLKLTHKNNVVMIFDSCILLLFRKYGVICNSGGAVAVLNSHLGASAHAQKVAGRPNAASTATKQLELTILIAN